ncbi:MAG: UDP-N-acetylmuramate dehydrogenase [Candidatus Paceibacterota bacterium]|jgi:UDP-N-acetylmuramate dehydrogenase
MEIKKFVNLSKYSTFKIGGDARFFCEVSNEAELKEALAFAEKENLRFFILGNGSNLLISDLGFDGFIIKNNIKSLNIESENSDEVVISAGAGEDWADFVKYSINENLSGVENLSGIPSSVGASAVQNIGAYGVEAKDIIACVEGLDANNGESFLLKNRECNFNYRDSIFKKNKNLIITKVYFNLGRKFMPKIEYPDLKKVFEGEKKLTPKMIGEAIIKIRKEKLPDLEKYGTAGSYFKNPVITEEKYLEIAKKYPELPKFPSGEGFAKIPLGYVLDKICGLKGFRQGNAGFYEKQALILVNFDGAKSIDIIALENLAKKMVKAKLGIDIEAEVEKI